MADDIAGPKPDRGDEEPSRPSLTATLLAWLRALGRGRNGEQDLRESLEELIVEHADSAEPIDADERLMLMNILKLNEIRVDDVMVPHADIVAVEVGASMEDLMSVFREASHSRLPVYSGTIDEVVGMVHIKDTPAFWSNAAEFKLRGLVRPCLFVPPSMRVMDLLQRMRKSRIHMAVVVDEFGGTDGLVTIEDLVEEIVGEIEDEHDQVEQPELIDRPDGSLEADARYPLADLEAKTGLALLSEDDDEEVDTLGGLVVSMLGRVPLRGEVVTHPSGMRCEVLDADPRRVKRVRLLIPAPERPQRSATG